MAEAKSRRDLANFRPRPRTKPDLPQADVEDDRIEAIAVDHLQRSRCGAAFDTDELFVQLELFRQRLAQRAIIIDDQNPTPNPHE